MRQRGMRSLPGPGISGLPDFVTSGICRGWVARPVSPFWLSLRRPCRPRLTASMEMWTQHSGGYRRRGHRVCRELRSPGLLSLDRRLGEWLHSRGSLERHNVVKHAPGERRRSQ
jgi:hypothetical protein